MLNREFLVKSCANAEFMAPSGKRTKLPVVQIGAFLAAEFEPIINLMEHKKLSLTENFGNDDKDDLVTYMSLADSILTNAELYITWCDENVLPITKKRNGVVFPFPLNHIQNLRKRRSVLKQLNFYDWKNLTFEDVVEKVDKLCQTLSMKLGEKEYFFKEGPCELDALVFGHLFCIFTMELPASVSPMKETINKYNTLTQFCGRMEKQYFGKIKS